MIKTAEDCMAHALAKLVRALKGFLKAADLAYPKLTKGLKMNEPTMLSGKSQISISKFEQICKILKINSSFSANRPSQTTFFPL
ncbi:MAG: hypothetical protein ACKOX6_11560 [Bdellovibrio sp.]